MGPAALANRYRRRRRWRVLACHALVVLTAVLPAVDAWAQSIGRLRSESRSAMRSQPNQPRDAPLDALEMRAAVVVRGAASVCTGAYLGRDVVLTSAACACAATAGDVLFDGGALQAKVRTVAVHGGGGCPAPPATGRMDLAIVRFDLAQADQLPKFGTGPEAAMEIVGGDAPAAVAAPALYLLPGISQLRVVAVAPGSTGTERIVNTSPIRSRLVSAAAAGVHVQGDAGCALSGALAYIWAPPRFVLVGIGTRPASGTCASQTYTLLTPAIVDWIVRHHGVPTTVCSSYGECRVHGGE
jgi:hypothetical protein